MDQQQHDQALEADRVRVKVPGARMRLGEKFYIVPGLSLRQLRLNRDLIMQMAAKEKEMKALQLPVVGIDDDEERDRAQQARNERQQELLLETFETAAKVVHLSLSRNYEVLLDDIQDLIDVNNIRPLLAVVMGQSGFDMVTVQPKEDAAVPKGER